MHWTVALDIDADNALDMARSTLRWVRPGDSITFVYIDETPNTAGLFLDPAIATLAAEAHQKALDTHRALLEALVDELRPEAEGIELTAKLREGDPVEALVEEGSACDAMMINTHGRRGLRRFWLGSVAERLVRLAVVPVLVLRGAPT